MKNTMRSRSKLTIDALVASAIVLLAGCSASQKWSISAEEMTVIADDGYSLITYELKMEPDIFDGEPPRFVLFYIQGSEYETVFSQVGTLAGVIAMGASVVVMERRGVDQNQNVDIETCHRYSMKEIRVEDHLKVIDAYLEGAVPGIPVILMGVSEGGDIASVVAAREDRVTHLILLGSGGGWSQAEEFEFFLSTRGSYLGLHDVDELTATFEAIRAQPDSMKMWAGHPYRRWSSYLWVRSIDYLEDLDIPIFLAHGDKDESVPVESARAVKERFDELDKSNLTYLEYENANHSFVDQEEGFLVSPLIEVDILRWLEELHIITREERDTFEDRVRTAHPECFDTNGS